MLSEATLSFAKNYVEKGLLRDGRKLLIVRSAVGGTGFLDRRWGLRDDLFLRMIEMSKTALCLHPSNRIVGLLWHQGETDADLGADRDGHYKRLWDLVEAVRSVFGSPDLPFLAGDFVEQWRKAGPQKADPVRAAMRDVCKNAGCAAFVETDGLASNDQQLGNGDTIHFSRNALAQLGERYFEAFYQLLA